MYNSSCFCSHYHRHPPTLNHLLLCRTTFIFYPSPSGTNNCRFRLESDRLQVQPRKPDQLEISMCCFDQYLKKKTIAVKTGNLGLCRQTFRLTLLFRIKIMIMLLMKTIHNPLPRWLSLNSQISPTADS
ncbi:hypothetical protein K1719_007140 [Acacia pycnantha]|nr:hypothetical protein K1719_007140 [Acacia pycnantha]